MSEKLALNVIAKDEKQQVDRIIINYEKYFDELCFAIDDEDTFKHCVASYHQLSNVKFFKYDWDEDEIKEGYPKFDKKRNFLADHTESTYYVRIDTDDEIDKPEIIRDSFDLMVKRNFDIVMYLYIYSQLKGGRIEHWRETIIKKRPDIYWKKSIHENMFVENQKLYKALRDDRVQIIHNVTEEHHAKSSKRNLKLLLREYQRDKQNTDPRTLAYIGRVFMGHGWFKEAIPFLEMLVDKSGWDDDKYFGWVQLSECWRELDRLDNAIGACNEALAISTKFPDAYLQMGVIYLTKESYQKALDWLMPGLVRPKPDTMFVLDTTVYTWRANLNAALAFFGKGDFERAIQYFFKAKKIAPSEAIITKLESIFINAYSNSMFIKNFNWFIKYLETNDRTKIIKLFDIVPKKILRDERIHYMRHRYEKPHLWSDKSIVMFCGNAPEEWTPASVHTGIGGSEEAVIYLSKELVLPNFAIKRQ